MINVIFFSLPGNSFKTAITFPAILLVLSLAFFSSPNHELLYTIYASAVNDCKSSACIEPVVNDASLTVEAVQKDLESPTGMAFLGPDDILVLEKDKGTVRRITNGHLLDKPILDVDVATEQERGMLGIAIARTNGEIDRSPYVFLYYTEAKGEDGSDAIGNRLYRYQLEGNRLVSPKLLLDLPVTPGPYHNGGKVIIGPDNLVYLLIGDLHDIDSDDPMNLQNDEAQKRGEEELDGRGGILRIDQDGKSADPVIGDDFPLNLYYSYGIRNGFGIDFDPVTDNLWDTENGEGVGDEINLVEPGFNSGWNTVQGIWLADRVDPFLPSSESEKADSQDTEELVDFGGEGKYSSPEFTWWQTLGPTALKFLSSGKLGESYKNDMFVGDVQFGNVYHFELNEDRTELALPGGPLLDKVADTDEELLRENGDVSLVFAHGFGIITDIQEGYDGLLYILSLDHGALYRIMPKS
jgi:glucose/arabinose dehydrogenase